MKKFSFPLARVMDFRRMQARLEESKLETLYSGLRGIDQREATMIQQREQAEKVLKTAPSVTGEQLQVFDSYGVAFKSELKRMDNLRIECRKRIQAQLGILATKRREVKLLEKLKGKKLETWDKEMNKEIDAQAEEAYLAKWKAPSEN